jgi:hypothetical protein
LQRQNNAALGFQTVKDKFGLDQDKLNSFATELIQLGINPLENDNVNLVDQYKLIHHDDIVKAEIAKAIAAEQARAAKATTSSSTPDNKQGNGGGGGEPGKVDSVRDLEKFLAAHVN